MSSYIQKQLNDIVEEDLSGWAAIRVCTFLKVVEFFDCINFPKSGTYPYKVLSPKEVLSVLKQASNIKSTINVSKLKYIWFFKFDDSTNFIISDRFGDPILDEFGISDCPTKTFEFPSDDDELYSLG